KARGAKFMGQPAHRLIAPLYPPAIDAQGNADCETGQQGYPNGPLPPGGRYGRGALSDGTPAGGNASVTDPDYPILSGGTFKARELGINNLRDVPSWRCSVESSAGRGMTGCLPSGPGVIAIVLIAVLSYFGFTKANPFASPYE